MTWLSVRRTLEEHAGWVIFAAGLGLYLLTLAPTYLWSDSAKLALYVHTRLFIGIGPGYGAHPFHSLAGYLFSFLPVPLAYSQNLMSAVFAAGSLGLLCTIVREVTGSLHAAMLAASALAVSHLFWLYAVINETYSLLAFFLLLALGVTLAWTRDRRDIRLYLLAAAIGAGVANHALMLLVVPGLLYLAWGDEFRRFIWSAKIIPTLAAFLLGSCQVTILPLLTEPSLAASLSAGAADTATTYRVFAGQLSKLVREICLYPLYLLYQFPPVGTVLGLYGLVAELRARSRLAGATVLMALPILLFASQYFLQRQFPMLIPTFVLFALWIGFGTARLLETCPTLNSARYVGLAFLLLCLLPPAVYYGAYRAADSFRVALPPIRTLPYRDTARYYFFPPKHMERGAQAYVEDSFKQAKPGAIILADFNPGMALLYGQTVRGLRPDVRITIAVDDWVHGSANPAQEMLRFLRQHVIERHETVYLADDWEAYYFTSEIKKEFDLSQTGGPLWEVSVKTPGPPR